jgi:hypothetical protein
LCCICEGRGTPASVGHGLRLGPAPKDRTGQARRAARTGGRSSAKGSTICTPAMRADPPHRLGGRLDGGDRPPGQHRGARRRGRPPRLADQDGEQLAEDLRGDDSR